MCMCMKDLLCQYKALLQLLPKFKTQLFMLILALGEKDLFITTP